MSLLHTLKSHIPERWLRPYHFVLAKVATFVSANPSEKLIVIGVTGTKGKSSTTHMIAQLLRAMGEKVGYTSTAGFAINETTFDNRMKMTMPGRFFLMGMLRKMVEAGCRYAVVETSSQGLTQFRHIGINYDTVVFTNLTPEHIEAHGGFAAYRAAKGLLFRHLTAKPRKVFEGKQIPKRAVLNLDDEHAAFYGAFPADEKIGYGWEDARRQTPDARLLVPTNVHRNEKGVTMVIDSVEFHVPLTAEFEQHNALAAIAALSAMGFALPKLAAAAAKLTSIPGRFERIVCGQPFIVIVDYAYEPKSLEALYRAVKELSLKNIIGVHGSAGGGRDVARREQIGRLAAQHEAVVIVTNEDPYDEDPMQIMRDVADGARAEGKKEGDGLFLVADRQEAIDLAMRSAQPGDVVVVTGKGSEPVMAVAGGKKVAWDDRVAARKALAALGYEG